MARGGRRAKGIARAEGGESRKRKEFQGRLSHSQESSARITEYFSVEDEEARESPVLGQKGGPQGKQTVLQQTDINKSSPQRNDVSKKQGKVTDYFPVRRSVRKTKKTVLEEYQKGLEEAVDSAKEEGLEIRVFEGKGRGVVATSTFHRGDFVVEYAGELISVEEARIREALYSRDENTGCYMYYFQQGGRSWCVDATSESGRLGRLVNHSRTGNLMTKATSIGGRPRLLLMAKTTILPGEELSYDYGDRSSHSLRHHPWLAL